MVRWRRLLHGAAGAAVRAGSNRAPVCGVDPRRCHGDQRLIAEKYPPSVREIVRASYRCGCGSEPFDRVGGRLTMRSLENDPGEKNLAGIEAATGARPETCPWRCLGHPFVAAVVAAHRHWDKGELALKYPRGVPAALMRGLEIYDAATNAVTVVDMRKERERSPEMSPDQPTAPPPPKRATRRR